MKKLFEFIKNLFLVFLIFPFSLSAREISFLPSYVIGEVPSHLKQKDNPSEGISELLAFYAKENYEVETTDFDSLRNFLESLEDETGRKPSKNKINSVCSEFEPDYLVYSEIDFDARGNIYSEIYNCKGRLLYKLESLLEKDFYMGMENHAKKLFSFLNPRISQTEFQYEQQTEIIFAVDTSGSISKEASQVLEYIDRILGRSNLKLGLIFISKKNYKLIRPTENPEKLRQELKQIRFSGEVSLGDLGTWLLKLTNELNLNTNIPKKFILLTDAKTGNTDNYKFITALQNLARFGFQVHILTGSYYDSKDASIYIKAAKASGGNLHQISHFQVLGTTKGTYSLFLKERKLYYQTGRIENIQDFQVEEAEVLKDTQVFSLVSYLHPSNMSEVFSKLMEVKIIQAETIQSNILALTDKIVSGSSFSLVKNFPKVLVKVGNQSIWLQLREVKDEWLNKDISFKVRFKKDNYSSLGFSNIPEESYPYKDSVPLLLSLNVKEIQKFFLETKKTSLVCFVSGKVLEIK